MSSRAARFIGMLIVTLLGPKRLRKNRSTRAHHGPWTRVRFLWDRRPRQRQRIRHLDRWAECGARQWRQQRQISEGVAAAVRGQADGADFDVELVCRCVWRD